MPDGPRPAQCPTCETALRVPAAAAGKTVRCPRCKEPFKVPEVAATVAPVPIPQPMNAKDDFDFFSDADDTDHEDEQPELARFWVVDPVGPNGPRNYRLYVGDGKLVGVFAGDERLPTGWWLRVAAVGALAGGFAGFKGTFGDGSLTEIAAAVAGGAAVGALIGAPAGALLGLFLQPFQNYENQAHAKRMAQLDRKPLHILQRNHEHNFTIRARDIEGAEIVAPSFGFRFANKAVPHIALLKLYLREQDNRVLALTTLSDVRQLVRLLGEITGRKIRATVGV